MGRRGDVGHVENDKTSWTAEPPARDSQGQTSTGGPTISPMPAQETVRQKVAMRTIALGRRLFANTAVQRLPITTRVLKRVFALGYGTDELKIDFRGVRLSVPADDITVVPGLVGGFYEEIELGIFEKLAAQSSLIVDVGGNVGVYACIGAARSPSGRVVTFEPVPANLAFLRRNVAANGLDSRVEIVEAALSDEPGEAPIFLADSIGTHSLSRENAESEREIKVRVTTLDEHLRGRSVDLIKIDVEGFDGHVLRGGRELLRSQRPTLLLEFVPSSLANSGFPPKDMAECLFDVHDAVFLIDEPRQTLERVTKSDLLALARDNGNRNLVAASNERHLDVIQSLVSHSATRR